MESALLAHAEPTSAKPRNRGTSARATPDDSAARAQLHEAKTMLGAATAEERQAKRRWAQAQRELEKTQAAVEKAQQELDRLHGD